MVFCLADDAGLGDFGPYGAKQVRTPNIDRLATEGMRFTQAYSGSAVCAPTRCALMTGLHPGHGTRRNNQSKNGLVPLRAEDFTAAELLKQAGYATGGFVRAGSTSDLLTSHVDFLPTMAELAGRPAKAGDGLSVLPTLLGKPQRARHEFRYWEIYEPYFQQAVRLSGPAAGPWWKGYRTGTKAPLELYDLRARPRGEAERRRGAPRACKTHRDGDGRRAHPLAALGRPGAAAARPARRGGEDRDAVKPGRGVMAR